MKAAPRLRAAAARRSDGPHVRIVSVQDDYRLVERATHLFVDALPERMRFADIAAMLRVSPKTLEAAYAALGLHPRSHLRQIRLARLHADLAAGRYETVGEAVVRWGFPSASLDLLNDYRRAYGCSPDQTLASALPNGPTAAVRQAG